MPDSTYLKDLAALVRYERNQMLNAADRLLALNIERQQAEEHNEAWTEGLHNWQTEMNAFLESFLIHFRNLLEFFAPTSGTQKETVTAAQFLDRSAKEQLDAPTSYRRDIHKRLAHISSARLEVRDEDKPWPFMCMVDAMERTWSQFIGDFGTKHAERVQWFSPPPQQGGGPSHAVGNTSVFRR